MKKHFLITTLLLSCLSLASCALPGGSKDSSTPVAGASSTAEATSSNAELTSSNAELTSSITISSSTKTSSSTNNTSSSLSSSVEVDTDRPAHTKKIGTASEPFSSTVCTDFRIYTIEMVNQYGDSILIHCGQSYDDPEADHSDDFNMLIDAGQSADTGTNGLVKKAISKYAGNDLDVVLFTHGHADHIGGMPGLFDEGKTDYDLDMFIDFGYIYGGSKGEVTVGYTSYENTRKALLDKGVNYCTATESLNNTGVCSTIYHLAPDLTYEIIDTGHYISDKTKIIKNDECNDTSIAGLLRYKDFVFLTTGDLDQESVIAKSDRIPDNIDLFKAAHHCSDTSNSTELLNHIHPNYVVISAACLGAFTAHLDGSTNKDHPNPVALKRIMNVVNPKHIYLNMTMGTIITKIDVNDPKNNITFSGEGAVKMRNPSGTGIPNILTEKDLPLVDTYFFNNTKISYTGSAAATLAERTGYTPS